MPVPTQTAAPHSQVERWNRWQETPITTRYLSADARQEGFTVVHVPPQSRELFLLLMELLRAYSRLPRHRRASVAASLPWKIWLQSTRQLVATLVRTGHGRPPLFPTFPSEKDAP